MKKLSIAIAAAIFSAALPCLAAEAPLSITQLTALLNEALNERSKLQKENPAVEYAESDNPASNFRKTSDQKGGRYPYGVTIVNREFYCPFCKKTTAAPTAAATARKAKEQARNAPRNAPKAEPAAEGRSPDVDAEGNVIHAPNCTKGKTAEAKWRELVAAVDATLDFNERIDEETEFIEDVKARIDDIRRGRSSDRPPLKIRQRRRTGPQTMPALESLFKVKFGSAVHPKEEDLASRAGEYFFTPRLPFRAFDRYTVSVVPSSGKVWAVRAEISPARALGANIEEEMRAARAAIEYKFDTTARALGPQESVFEFAAESGSTNVARRVYLSPGAITAFDLKLREEAWKEDPSRRPIIPALPSPEEEELSDRKTLERDAEAL